MQVFTSCWYLLHLHFDRAEAPERRYRWRGELELSRDQAEGERLGVFDGERVGRSEGLPVGSREGARLGGVVGVLLGTDVG
jgi:hypothetical protein